MGRSAVFSGLLHVAVILLTVMGLPWLYSDEEILQATTVSTISEAQFAELQSKTPPAQKKKDQPKDETIPDAPDAPPVAEPEVEPEPEPEPEPVVEAEPAPEPAPPEPAPPAPVVAVPEPEPAPPEPDPTPPEPETQAETAPAPQDQVIAPPEPEPQPEEPVVPPEQQLAEAQPKPVPPKKPKEPKKKETKKEEKPKQEKPKDTQVAESSDSFLKDVSKKLKKSGKSKKTKSAPDQQAALPEADYDGPPLNEGEKDLIRQQIKSNWIIDLGMPGLEEMTVEVNVRMNPDGSVVSAKADRGSSNGHPNWNIYAESCVRAVLKSSPLRMPPEKPYEAWKTMTLVFNARDMLGY